jgi:hypothetical protein
MKNSNDTIGNRTRNLPACSRSPPTNSAIACPVFMPYLFQTPLTCLPGLIEFRLYTYRQLSKNFPFTASYFPHTLYNLNKFPNTFAC